MINETVGDAISDMLLVETILHTNGWDVKDWLATYTELPNIQQKILVADRNVIRVADADRNCVTPDGLQDEIDRLVAKYPKGRSFVRPSGTEDVVRIYAEAATREVIFVLEFSFSVFVISNFVSIQDTDKLAAEVSLITHRMAGGIGREPAAPMSHM